MRTRRVATAEQAGALHDHLDIQFCPGQVCRIPLGEYFDTVTVDHQVTILNADCPWELAMCRIVPGQMGIGIRVTKIVDGDNGELIGTVQLIHGPQNVAADAAISVDCDSHWHTHILLIVD